MEMFIACSRMKPWSVWISTSKLQRYRVAWRLGRMETWLTAARGLGGTEGRAPLPLDKFARCSWTGRAEALSCLKVERPPGVGIMNCALNASSLLSGSRANSTNFPPDFSTSDAASANVFLEYREKSAAK